TNKGRTVGLVGVVTLVILVHAVPGWADGRQVYRDAVGGTARVIAGDSGGTGLLVGRERRLLLAAHPVGVAFGPRRVYNAGAVRQVYRFDRVIGLQHVAARVIETQSPLNPGDSGGPLFNDAGEVVGVHCCIKPDTQLIGESIDLSEIKAFLADEQPLL